MLSAEDHERLLETVLEVARCRTRGEVHAVLRDRVRALTGADGISIVVREDDGHVRYVDESAIAPLWKGEAFPIDRCISGWVMLNREAAAIDDIRSDPRIPLDAYQRTFVRSLIMTPIRNRGALGAYWREVGAHGARERTLLSHVAAAAAIAFDAIESTERSEQEVRARDALLATASHEVRNALNGVVLRTATLRAAVGKCADEALRDNFTKLERLVTHTADVLDSLLDVARLSAGALELVVERTDLVAVARSAIARLEDEANAAGVSIELRAPPSIEGEWDALRIAGVITNLLRNALRYGLGAPVTVDVSLRGDDVEISVADAGPGLAVPLRERAFDPFVVGPAPGGRRGTGLGLWIAKRTAEAHRGSLEVASQVGRGTTFTLRVPRWLRDLLG